MKAAMLFDNASAIDGDHQSVGEGFPDQTDSHCVEIGLGIDRTEDGPVDDQEISVCGR